MKRITRSIASILRPSVDPSEKSRPDSGGQAPSSALDSREDQRMPPNPRRDNPLVPPTRVAQKPSGPALKKIGSPPSDQSRMSLTRASLDAWVKEKGVTSQERKERTAIKKLIIQCSSPEQTTKSKDLPLVVTQPLSIKGYRLVTSLPQGLVTENDVFIHGCERLEALPQGMEVGGSLEIDACRNLYKICDNLIVRGDLRMSAWGTKSMSCGADLRIGGDLNFQACEFRSIGASIEVYGDANFSECRSLRHLGIDMRVGKNLRLFALNELEK